MDSPPDETGIEIIGEPAVPPSTLDLPRNASKQSTPDTSPSKSRPVSENLDVPGSKGATPKSSPKSSPQSLRKDQQGDASPKPQSSDKSPKLTPSEESPKLTPTAEASPKVTPSTEASPKLTPQGSPKLTPTKGSPKLSPTTETSPKLSPTTETSPKLSPTAESSPKLSPTTESSPKLSPTTESSPKLSPTTESSPKLSPTTEISPKLSPTTEALPKLTTPEGSPKLTPKGSPKLTPDNRSLKSGASHGSTKSMASGGSRKSATDLPVVTSTADDNEGPAADGVDTDPQSSETNETKIPIPPATIIVTDVDGKPSPTTETASTDINGKPKTPVMEKRKSLPPENGSPKVHIIQVSEKRKSTDDNEVLPAGGDGHHVVTIDTGEDSRRPSQTTGDQSKTTSEKEASPAPSLDDKKGLIRKERHTIHHVARDICKVFGVLFALGVRLVLLAFCGFTVWLVVYRLDNTYYWLLSITFILLIIESINIVVSRAGQERKWFCACFMCYLLAVIPCIWILELDRLDTFQSTFTSHSNTSHVVVNVAGVTADIKLDPNTLLSVTEQCLIFLLILGRWLLPRGEITRDQLSQLLFVFIGMASDVMELFQLFDESSVRHDRTLTIIVLSVWSFSLLQFTLVLTMSRSPKKIRTAMDHDDETARIKKGQFKDSCCLMVVVQTELWSLGVAMLMQDGPFLAVRLYTIITYELINYTIIFFTCKNILVIMLLFYRIMILCLERNDDNDDDDDDEEYEYEDDKKQDDNRHRSKTVSTRLSLSDIEDETAIPKASDGTEGVRARRSNQVAPV